MIPGEIYIAHFPFGAGGGSKLRPVLLVTEPIGTVPEILVAYISSVVPAHLLPSDIILDANKPEHTTTNLKTISVVRLHKLATLHQRSAVRRLDHVSSVTESEVASKLRSLLRL